MVDEPISELLRISFELVFESNRAGSESSFRFFGLGPESVVGVLCSRVFLGVWYSAMEAFGCLIDSSNHPCAASIDRKLLCWA